MTEGLTVHLSVSVAYGLQVRLPYSQPLPIAFGCCYFLSVPMEIKCNYLLHSVHTDGNLYAYMRYFPSAANYYTWFPSVPTEINCNNSLFSVCTDGNLQLNFAIFRPYGRKNREIKRLISVCTDGSQALNFAIFRPYEHWFSRWCHIIVQSTSANQLNQTDPNANPNPNPKPY